MKKSLELYLHIPFCMKKCAYCDFLSFQADERIQLSYVQALIREMQYYGARMGEYEVTTVFVGGGTPSWLSESSMQEIFAAVYRNFNVVKDAEITIECNPGTLTARKLLVYKGCGINRLSIGLQSTDNEELKLLGRVHTYEQFLKTYEMARVSGFQNINVDLMSGLPYQTADKFVRSLKKVISLKPEHISVYTLMIEKGTPFYEEYKFDAVKQEAGMQPEILPNEDEVYRIYKETQIRLAQAGYRQYEISNYAHPKKECRHNIGYWTRENYLGLGLGAASLVENVRYSNTRDLYRYMDGTKMIREKPQSSFYDGQKSAGTEGGGEQNSNAASGGGGRQDERSSQGGSAEPSYWMGTNLHESADPVPRKARMEEFMFLGLRMNCGVSRDEFERNFGITIDAIYKEVIEELRREELLLVQGGRIALTDKGMDLSNYVMSKFLF